jgi:hypothetical protein
MSDPPKPSALVELLLRNNSVMGKVYGDMMECVVKNDGWIAGSIILQAILGVKLDDKAWEHSDIDIWIPSKGKIGTFIDILEAHGYTYSRSMPVDRPEYARLTKFVNYIYSFKRRKCKTIQVVKCKIDSISHVVQTFDIRAAQIVYRSSISQGAKIAYIKPILGAHLYMMNV